MKNMRLFWTFDGCTRMKILRICSGMLLLGCLWTSRGSFFVFNEIDILYIFFYPLNLFFPPDMLLPS